MFGGKYNTVLTVLLVIAIVAIIGLLGYLGYSIFNKYSTEASMREVADAFEEQYKPVQNTIKEPQTSENENTVGDEPVITIPGYDNPIIIPSGDEGSISQGGNSGGGSQSQSGGNSGGDSTPVKLNGYDVIGTIEIPAIQLKSTILSKVTRDALKTSICYLYGPGINQVGNNVLQGHNYRNGKFFSNLSKLKDGDVIYLSDTSRNRIQYKVYRNFEASATDASFYERDTNGKREITLSTCTEDERTRTIVFAREI